MREFRGKHIHMFPQNKHLDGLWVYGYLCDENYINAVMVDEYGRKYTSEMLVDPKTVGQYVGLTDCTGWEGLSECEKDEFLSEWNFEENRQNVEEDWKGRKIFEGDIVKLPKCENDIAVFVLEGCNYFLKGNNSNYVLESFRSECYEVVGNIYDNPELV